MVLLDLTYYKKTLSREALVEVVVVVVWFPAAHRVHLLYLAAHLVYSLAAVAAW